MTTTENTPNSNNSKIIFLLLFVAIVVAVLSSLSGVQKLFQPLFNPSNRVVLAKVSTSELQDPRFLVLKVKDPTGLQIEVYQINAETSAQELKQKFDLAQDADAYVTIDKNSTNLALSDVDHDGHLDILAPSVDRNGNLRLNTFRFNNDLKSFEPYIQTAE